MNTDTPTLPAALFAAVITSALASGQGIMSEATLFLPPDAPPVFGDVTGDYRQDYVFLSGGKIYLTYAVSSLCGTVPFGPLMGVSAIAVEPPAINPAAAGPAAVIASNAAGLWRITVDSSGNVQAPVLLDTAWQSADQLEVTRLANDIVILGGIFDQTLSIARVDPTVLTTAGSHVASTTITDATFVHWAASASEFFAVVTANEVRVFDLRANQLASLPGSYNDARIERLINPGSAFERLAVADEVTGGAEIRVIDGTTQSVPLSLPVSPTFRMEGLSAGDIGLGDDCVLLTDSDGDEAYLLAQDNGQFSSSATSFKTIDLSLPSDVPASALTGQLADFTQDGSADLLMFLPGQSRTIMHRSLIEYFVLALGNEPSDDLTACRASIDPASGNVIVELDINVQEYIASGFDIIQFIKVHQDNGITTHTPVTPPGPGDFETRVLQSGQDPQTFTFTLPGRYNSQGQGTTTGHWNWDKSHYYVLATFVDVNNPDGLRISDTALWGMRFKTTKTESGYENYLRSINVFPDPLSQEIAFPGNRDIGVTVKKRLVPPTPVAGPPIV